MRVGLRLSGKLDWNFGKWQSLRVLNITINFQSLGYSVNIHHFERLTFWQVTLRIWLRDFRKSFRRLSWVLDQRRCSPRLFFNFLGLLIVGSWFLSEFWVVWNFRGAIESRLRCLVLKNSRRGCDSRSWSNCSNSTCLGFWFSLLTLLSFSCLVFKSGLFPLWI